MSVEEDRAEITNVLAKYAFTIDGRDWEGLRECFTDDAQASYNRVTLAPGADAIVNHVRGLENMPASQHVFGAPGITIDGDSAKARSYAVAYLVVPGAGGDGHVLVSRGLSYTDELVRGPNGWLISTRFHECYWSTDQPTVWPVPPMKS
jgi:hypothetical protein